MKHRFSVQRDLIYKELKKQGGHLTADEIHKLVKKVRPSVSFGTVYRNLGILENQCEIKKLMVSSDKAVYEAEMQPHHHLICKKCGSIVNVYKPANLKCVKCLSFMKDFKIDDAYINAFGECDKCHKD